MSGLIQAKIQTYPIEIFDYFARSFNAVSKKGILKLKSTNLNVNFFKFTNSRPTVPIHLFKKLVQAFNSIRNKYLSSTNPHVRLKFDENEENYIIKIIGVNKIPPGKVFKMFDLILNLYIKYISGVKPSASMYGRELTASWKKEKEYIKHQLFNSPKNVIYGSNLGICQICGNEAILTNKWQFYFSKERRYIEISTDVCEKHRTEVL